MWHFTKYGFYSAVCARKDEGKGPVDPDRIMVRARLRGHLQALIDRFPERLAECEIKSYPGSDYAFRIFVDKPAWTQTLAALAEELDYDNFKSATARFQRGSGADYLDALHDVWEVTYRLQKSR